MKYWYFLFVFGLLRQEITAQSLHQLPNANFSTWTGAEPAGWQTNNIYDDQGKLLQNLVVPVGGMGARLLAKQVAYRTEAPAIEAWYSGQLTSPLIPYMPAEGKPIIVTIRYRFRPDSADVLRAEVRLDSRNNLGTTSNPDPACICRFKDVSGPITLPSNQTSVTLHATFADPTNPNQVPPGCAMYVWKMRFWLTNGGTHAHEATEAIIDQVALQP